ncbi:hypothetical protein [Novosphingobium sp. Rr 2-17]|uniref:hypothetical protein n=1 Tax=Novosphingobium sp. Rr 2-17 TaxID=555793 RepID=UPI00030A8F03|nr:hypothetical protein [Novosphingobium sp. Rr 2-17]
MTLTEQTLATVDAVLRASEGSAGQVRSLLLAQCPGLSVMQCDASDVLEEPFRSYAAIDLHLVDARGHCVQMTADLNAATGILLASGSTPV